MSDLVSPHKIEGLVGAERHPTEHYGRAMSANHRMYILHSHACRDTGIDLRDCEYSKALDKGINMDSWRGQEDKPVLLAIKDRRLVPAEGEN